eukprot:COSAG03_NODE_6628_length_1027_cov_2.389666_2_plen_245_part_00
MLSISCTLSQVVHRLFFSGRKSASREEKPNNADAWTRWTSKRVLVARRGFHPRMPIAAARRIQADQRPPARALPRVAPQNVSDGRAAERARGPRPAPRTAEGPTAKFARAVVRFVCGADGNTVQTTAPPTVPASLVTASTQMTAQQQQQHACPGREEETTCRAAILQVAELRQQNDPEAPGNGRSGRAGELARAGGEVVPDFCTVAALCWSILPGELHFLAILQNSYQDRPCRAAAAAQLGTRL